MLRQQNRKRIFYARRRRRADGIDGRPRPGGHGDSRHAWPCDAMGPDGGVSSALLRFAGLRQVPAIQGCAFSEIANQAEPCFLSVPSCRHGSFSSAGRRRVARSAVLAEAFMVVAMDRLIHACFLPLRKRQAGEDGLKLFALLGFPGVFGFTLVLLVLVERIG